MRNITNIIASYFTMLLVTLFLAGCAGKEKRIAEISTYIIKENSSQKPDFTSIGKMSARFSDSLINDSQLKTYSDATLDQLYDAVDTSAYYFKNDSRYIQMENLVFDEKIRRGKYTDSDVRNICRNYLAYRLFDKANALKAAFPNVKLPTVPEISISSSVLPNTPWRVYDITDKGQKAELTALHLDSGPVVVMIMATGCSSSEVAMETILKNEQTTALFTKYGVVITDKFDSVGVSLWRSHFQFHNIFIIENASGFPDFEFKNFPHFYFLKDGKVIAQYIGWNKDTNLALAEFNKNISSIVGKY